MRPIAPRIDGADEFTVAEPHQVMEVALVEYPDGIVARVCRWTFTPEERERIARGEDIYFGTPATIKLTPHWLKVGFP